MSFDVESFLNTTVTDSNDTKVVPVPTSCNGKDLFLMIADKVEVRQWQGKADPSKFGLALDINWIVEDEDIKAHCAREKVYVKQGIMLDMNDSGGLDMGKGKNTALGKLREALGLNAPGQPFSFSMITGRMAKNGIKHRENPNDPEAPFAEVSRNFPA